MDQNLDKLKNQGKELIAQKKYLEAIEIYEQLAVADSESVFPFDTMGFLYYMTKDFKRARECCLTSLSIKTNHYYALKGLGLSLVRLGQVEEGIAKLKESIEANPDYFDSSFDLGVTFIELGRWEEAREYLNRANNIDPSRSAVVKQALDYLEKHQG